MTGTHVRQQVCNQIAALLAAVPYYTGKVFLSRTARLNEAEIPAAVVVFEHEVIENLGTNRPARGVQRRTIITAVYVVEKDPDNVEMKLDSSCALVEQAVLADSTLQGVAVYTIMDSVEPYVRSDPTLPTGVYRVLFSSIVYTMEGDPYNAIQQ